MRVFIVNGKVIGNYICLFIPRFNYLSSRKTKNSESLTTSSEKKLKPERLNAKWWVGQSSRKNQEPREARSEAMSFDKARENLRTQKVSQQAQKKAKKQLAL